MKKKYIFLFLFIFFFLDFAFLPNLLTGHWRFPYFLVLFLFSLLIKRNFKENILVLFIGTYLLTIVTGISWWLMLLIWISISGLILFLKTIFLEKIVSFQQANLIFVIITIVYFAGIIMIDKFFITSSPYFAHWFNWIFYFLLLASFFNFNLWLEDKF